MLHFRAEEEKDQFLFGHQGMVAVTVTRVIVMATPTAYTRCPFQVLQKMATSLGILRRAPQHWPPPIAVVQVARDKL